MLKLYLSTINKYKDKKKLNDLLCVASDYRLSKYSYLKNEEDKLQSIIATHIIDTYLKTIGLKEKNMVYADEKYGKPYFENYEHIHFNISHSKNIVAVAFSDKQVGVDIQVVKNIDEKVFKKVLSEKELSSIKIENQNLKEECFFYYWVQKEASIKRDGKSICDDLKKINMNYNLVKRICLNKNSYEFISFDEITNVDDIKSSTKEDLMNFEIYYLCVNNKEDENIDLYII